MHRSNVELFAFAWFGKKKSYLRFIFRAVRSHKFDQNYGRIRSHTQRERTKRLKKRTR